MKPIHEELGTFFLIFDMETIFRIELELTQSENKCLT